VRHVRMLGLCLVAVFAFAAVAASSAMAEGPEWGRCLNIEPAKGKEIKKGNYEDPNCQKVATKISKGKEVASHKGHYEWYAGTKTYCEKKGAAEFTYKDKECSVVAEKKGVPDHKGKYEWGPGPKFTASGGAGVLNMSLFACARNRVPRSECKGYYHGKAGEAAFREDYVYSGTAEVKCASETATGEAVGTNEVANVEVRFKGCKFAIAGMKSAGAEPGEIRTEKLKGRLGYINKNTAPVQVGLLLQPASGTVFAIFRSESETIPLEIKVGVGSSTEGAYWTPESTGGGDGVISPIVPVNAMTHTFTQEYRKTLVPVHYKSYNAGGEAIETPANATENVPASFEGGPLEVLEGYTENFLHAGELGASTTWSPSSEEINNVDTVEGEDEIKA
jgi:hypothetical protein